MRSCDIGRYGWCGLEMACFSFAHMSLLTVVGIEKWDASLRQARRTPPVTLSRQCVYGKTSLCPPGKLGGFLRPRPECLYSSPTLNKLDRHHNEGDDQEQVNDSTHRLSDRPTALVAS